MTLRQTLRSNVTASLQINFGLRFETKPKICRNYNWWLSSQSLQGTELLLVDVPICVCVSLNNDQCSPAPFTWHYSTVWSIKWQTLWKSSTLLSSIGFYQPCPGMYLCWYHTQAFTLFRFCLIFLVITMVTNDLAELSQHYYSTWIIDLFMSTFCSNSL